MSVNLIPMPDGLTVRGTVDATRVSGRVVAMAVVRDDPIADAATAGPPARAVDVDDLAAASTYLLVWDGRHAAPLWVSLADLEEHGTDRDLERFERRHATPSHR